MTTTQILEHPSGAITAIAPAQRQCALHALTLAFVDDPACRWLYPDEADYRHYFPAFATSLGAAGIDRGTAISIKDMRGVALWLEPGVGPDAAALEALVEQSVPAMRRNAVLDLFGEMERVHPREPHWYLPLIGVAPASQGCGIGTMLLGPGLSVCDAVGLPAYLEATSARSIPLYQRHGFVVVGELRVGNCPPIVPMLRKPHSRRSRI